MNYKCTLYIPMRCILTTHHFYIKRTFNALNYYYFYSAFFIILNQIDFIKEHTLLEKQYVSHTNKGISFAFTEYKRSNETRFLHSLRSTGQQRLTALNVDLWCLRLPLLFHLPQ